MTESYCKSNCKCSASIFKFIVFFTLQSLILRLWCILSSLICEACEVTKKIRPRMPHWFEHSDNNPYECPSLCQRLRVPTERTYHQMNRKNNYIHYQTRRENDATVEAQRTITSDKSSAGSIDRPVRRIPALYHLPVSSVNRAIDASKLESNLGCVTMLSREAAARWPLAPPI